MPIHSRAQKANVALMLPLFYDNIDELSFDSYNIDERRSRNYKCFSYIGFYEGVRIALDELEKQGYAVDLYVFDVGENDTNKLKQALNYEKMPQMDIIIPLVFKNSFEILSRYSLMHQIPLINPMSGNNDILKNPYVFKIQPDDLSISNTILTYLKVKHPQDKILVTYDDKYTSREIINFWKENLPKISSKWTILNCRKGTSKIKNYLDKQGKTMVISLNLNSSDKDNKLYAKKIISSLIDSKTNISLIAPYKWIEYVGNDYKNLQSLDYHFPLSYYNDYTNNVFVNFTKLYRKNFFCEPTNIYPSIGYDIVNYFIPCLMAKGDKFHLDCNCKNPSNMIHTYHFTRKNSTSGWQNSSVTIYKMEDYKIKSEWRN